MVWTHYFGGIIGLKRDPWIASTKLHDKFDRLFNLVIDKDAIYLVFEKRRS